MSLYGQFSDAELARTICGDCGFPIWVERSAERIIALPCTNPDCPDYKKQP